MCHKLCSTHFAYDTHVAPPYGEVVDFFQRLWRPRPESNRRTRICSPLRHHSATWPHQRRRVVARSLRCQLDHRAGIWNHIGGCKWWLSDERTRKGGESLRQDGIARFPTRGRLPYGRTGQKARCATAKAPCITRRDISAMVLRAGSDRDNSECSRAKGRCAPGKDQKNGRCCHSALEHGRESGPTQ